MTPSINLLADSAKALALRIVSTEFRKLQDEFYYADADLDSYEEYEEWVTKFPYYNAVVCIYGGEIAKIRVRLQDDYFEYFNQP